MEFRIPLLLLKVGGRRYHSKKPLGYYNYVRQDMSPMHNGNKWKANLKAVYVVNGISGESLYLHSPTGSLEGMVVKLLLENYRTL